MDKKNDAQVKINGKVYYLKGYEDSEYFYKIADYINNKQAEIKEKAGKSFINDAEGHLLMLINFADDYFKALDEIEKEKAEIHTKSREAALLKNEVTSLKAKLDAAEKEIVVLKEKLDNK